MEAKRVYRYQFTWQDFDVAVELIASKLSNRLAGIKSVYGIPRGGLVLAVALSHRLNLPMTTSPDEHTLVVDDISDSGRTFEHYWNFVTASIHIVPDTLSVPNVWAFVRPKDCWVIYPWERG